MRKNGHAGTRNGSNGNGDGIAGEITEVINRGQVRPRESRSVRAHQLIARLDPVTNPTPKTVRAGNALRHMQRGNFNLQVTSEFSPSIFINGVIEHLDGKLASQVGEKVCPELMMDVFRAIDPKSFSLIPALMHEARDHVFQVLNESSNAIAANLWLTEQPSVDTFTRAINAKRRIVTYFANSDELLALEEKLTAATKCPGWLPIERVEKVLLVAKPWRGLTMDDTLITEMHDVNKKYPQGMSIFSFMQARAAEFLRERQALLRLNEYNSIPMSTARIGKRIMEPENRHKFPVPNELNGLRHKTTVEGVIFFRGGVEISHTRMILFGPYALQVLETPEGNLVAFIAGAGDGGSFIGLSREEQDFLRHQYEARVRLMEAVRHRQ